MSVILRVLLIAGAVFACAFVLREIRRSKMLMSDSIFWIVMSVLLVVVSLFPQLLMWISDLLGVQSPANFVFLVVSAILIVKLFFLSLDVSKLKRKLTVLVEEYAVRLKEQEDRERETK